MTDFTVVEAINLITRLYLPLSGYWKDEIDEVPEAQKMLDAGCMCLDEEYGDKYLINDTGRAVLHPYIEQISNEFIKFMKKKGGQCLPSEARDWFITKYQLSDIALGEDICEYICKNLSTYGYIVYLPHPDREGDHIILTA